MSQDRRATDIQQSYVERDGVDFSRRKTDWQFYRGGNNGIGGSIEQPEQNWRDRQRTEFVSGGKNGVEEAMSGTGVY